MAYYRHDLISGTNIVCRIVIGFCCIEEEEEAAAYLIEGSGFVEIYESGLASLFIKSSIGSDELGGIASSSIKSSISSYELGGMAS